MVANNACQSTCDWRPYVFFNIDEINSDFSTCGRNNIRDGFGFENIIVRNGSSKIGEYPWIVSYGQLNDDGTWIHSCGGSIISDSHILTAFHCFRDLNLANKEM